MNPKRWTLVGLVLLTLLRFWLAGTCELTPDEAYQYLWSRHPDVCYFGSGPGIAAAIWMGSALFGATELGVRLLAPLLAVGTSGIAYAFAKRLYSEKVALWTVVTLNALPLFNAGAVFVTPDALAVFFWSAALLTFWLALEHSSNREEDLPGAGWSLWWPATGALVGVGFLCKWANALQLLCAVLLLLTSARFRRHFRQPGFWSMLLVFAIFTLPPLLWNARSGGMAFAGEGSSLKAPSGFLSGLWTVVWAHFVAYSPLLFVLMVEKVRDEASRARDHLKPRFLLVFALPGVVLGVLSATDARAALFSTASSLFSLVVLGVAAWVSRLENAESATGGSMLRVVVSVSLVLGIFMSAIGSCADLLHRAGLPPAAVWDPAYSAHGWRVLSEKIEMHRINLERESGSSVFLIADSRRAAATTAFYLQNPRLEGEGHPPIYIPESQAFENQFSLWPRYDEFVALKGGQHPADAQFTEESGINPFHGKTALFFSEIDEDHAPSAIRGGFEKTELLACYNIERFGRILRKVRVFKCTNYRSLPL